MAIQTVQMELHRIIISDMMDQQIIMLKEVDGERKFPIVIGSSVLIGRRRTILNRFSSKVVWCG